jgi:putative phosphoribosyl transferase
MLGREGFSNRTEAGRALGEAVANHVRRTGYQGRPLVLALPRGGVPVGVEVARAINGELDVMVARKVGLPWQPELGVGAVTEDGPPVMNTEVLQRAGLSSQELSAAVDAEREEVRRRLRRYRNDRPPPRVDGRLVVVTDDGLATGVTARAALRALRQQNPWQLLFAAPVCAADAADLLANDADAVICLIAPRNLGAISVWYEDFPQLDDAEVEELLNEARRVPARPPG